MKKLAVICFIIIFNFLSVVAQNANYTRLLEESSAWRVGQASCGWYVTDLRMSERDTLINGQIYDCIEEYDIYSETLIQSFYVREDISSRKVYHYHEAFQAEFLIYDFSVQAGDTFDLQIVSSWEEIIITLPHIVNEVDEVQLESGEWRKRIHLTRLPATVNASNTTWDIPEAFDYAWIEGVGCDSMRVVDYFPDTWRSTLFCHQRRGQTIMENDHWGSYCDNFEIETAMEMTLNIEENSSQNTMESFVEVSPNPASSAWQIKAKHATNTISTLQLYNIKGQLLNSYSLENETIKVANEHLPKGIYLLKMVQEGKVLGSLKLQKQ
ncbi:MAG: T9SS type A sorting domain-containing protein [Chitinophagales bacterium]